MLILCILFTICTSNQFLFLSITITVKFYLYKIFFLDGTKLFQVLARTISQSYWASAQSQIQRDFCVGKWILIWAYRLSLCPSRVLLSFKIQWTHIIISDQTFNDSAIFGFRKFYCWQTSQPVFASDGFLTKQNNWSILRENSKQSLLLQGCLSTQWEHNV